MSVGASSWPTGAPIPVKFSRPMERSLPRFPRRRPYPSPRFPAETLRSLLSVSKRLVTVFDEHGTLISAFGDHIDSTDHPSLNELLNRGRVTGDLAGQIYFAFTYLPDPTIRKYDRSGFGAYVISLTVAEFGIAKQDQRKDIFGIERTSEAVSVQPVIGAVGVDSATQQVWASIGNSLVQFDKDGSRLLTYRTVTQDGVRVQPTAILIESDRLLLAADPIGVLDFARPDKAQPKFPSTESGEIQDFHRAVAALLMKKFCESLQRLPPNQPSNTRIAQLRNVCRQFLALWKSCEFCVERSSLVRIIFSCSSRRD